MKHRVLLTAVVVVSLLWADTQVSARGGRGGGAARSAVSRGGGGAARTPSMSRAGSPSSVSRPSLNRPTPSRPAPGRVPDARPGMTRPGGGGTGGRPAIGSRPELGNKLPGGGSSRPDWGANRPGGGNRPDFGGKLPGAVQRPDGGDRRPNLPDRRPGPGGRLPELGGGNLLDRRPGGGPSRPSRDDLQDFLNLPGTRPDRPRPGLRPDGDRINIGDRGNQIGDRTNIGNRIGRGDTNVNINAGNRLTVNRQNNINSIRNRWSRVNQRPFGRAWWGRHPRAGVAWRWHRGWTRFPVGWCWRPATWTMFGTWFTWTWAKPYTFNYGTTVVYRDNYVYVDGNQVATADVFYEQAESIAGSVPRKVESDEVEWMPLGVFAIAEESAADTGMLIQLAVSREGIIAGTFYDETTETSRPLEGMVDQETQRVAWRMADGSNPDLVMETGIYNLTEDETTAFVHFGREQRQTWLMIRLSESEEQ